MVDAERRPRPRLQPALGYGHAAHRAQSVGSCRYPRQCVIDLLQANLALAHEGGRLGQLEGYGAALGIVFVVHIGVLPGEAHRTDVASQRLEQFEFATPFLLQKDPKPLDVNHGGS